MMISIIKCLQSTIVIQRGDNQARNFHSKKGRSKNEGVNQM